MIIQILMMLMNKSKKFEVKSLESEMIELEIKFSQLKISDDNDWLEDTNLIG